MQHVLVISKFGTKLYRQVVAIPMGSYYIPLIADVFMLCYERYYIMSLSDDKQVDKHNIKIFDDN